MNLYLFLVLPIPYFIRYTLPPLHVAIFLLPPLRVLSCISWINTKLIRRQFSHLYVKHVPLNSFFLGVLNRKIKPKHYYTNGIWYSSPVFLSFFVRFSCFFLFPLPGNEDYMFNLTIYIYNQALLCNTSISCYQ